MPDYPSNSINSGDVPTVTEVDEATELIDETPSLGKRFLRSFFPEGGAKKAGAYVFDQVLVPMVKDMALKAINGAAREFLGVDVSRATQALVSSTSVDGAPYVKYSSASAQQAPQQPASVAVPATSRFDTTRYRFSSYEAADQIREAMMNIIAVQNVVTFEQFLTMIGRQSAHTDNGWGWKSLDGAYVAQHQTGAFILCLPQPMPLRTGN